MFVYTVWNNKGGTGKTSLTFQAVCRFAENAPKDRILVIDACPQANLSELFLGGMSNSGSAKLLERQGMVPRCSIGGYFDARLPAPFAAPAFDAWDYITNPHDYNEEIPKNIDLVCGDPLLELQAIAMNTLANADLPGVNTWLGVIDWLNDFLAKIEDEFDYVFIDTNPSFSMYTQLSLASADGVILPVMADDSSRRAIQNAFSLMYGLKLPSEVYSKYTFATKMNAAGRELPKIHLILKNRLTQYMGKASAYEAVLSGIDKDLRGLIRNYPDYFTFQKVSDGIVDVRDFGTTGVVAFARGCPFSVMPTGKLDIGGHRVQVKPEYRDQALEAIDDIVEKI
ncbi:TPA: ParA family protein [Pseudomonas aeruginosa]|uniref:ParA family protein n=1 Tax=Pseudomonas aeruginosa TaxID=287 RepID=UPI0009406CD3|nr:ParA family protein [Pseudomonas aeruginosa]MCS8200900.1 ParA family protein [Pseudomonas aeruginosa]MCS8206746.1 ParA family protein [Pseudomonas aeruginosa]MDU0664922.1 ParA family protein [Pseudomonas aeruginosa]OKS23721.1 ATPase [Pseudomonas aeruginosa]PBN10930.1 ATPase [Pseudomonas aeruginosa]